MALIAAFGVALGRPHAFAQQTANNSKPRKVGPFQVTFGLLEGSAKGGVYIWNFTGLSGGKVRAKTGRYDLNAPRITMRITPTSAPESAEATGGVDGEARDPERQQVVTFRGDKATYHAAGKETLARIDFIGNVRFVFRNPQFESSDPLTVNVASGSLVFQRDGQITYGLRNGDATGTPVEPKTVEKP